MMKYRRECARKENIADVKGHTAAERYFEEIGLSLLYTSEEVRCIPSFVNLLDGTSDEQFERFLCLH